MDHTQAMPMSPEERARDLAARLRGTLDDFNRAMADAEKAGLRFHVSIKSDRGAQPMPTGRLELSKIIHEVEL